MVGRKKLFKIHFRDDCLDMLLNEMSPAELMCFFVIVNGLARTKSYMDNGYCSIVYDSFSDKIVEDVFGLTMFKMENLEILRLRPDNSTFFLSPKYVEIEFY